MNLSNLMIEVDKAFNDWMNDDELQEIYVGIEDDLKRQFIQCIQDKIGTKFILLTEKELDSKLHSYHCGMEGYEE